MCANLINLQKNDKQTVFEVYLALGKVNFQPVNTGRGAHLPLEANWARLIFRCVGLATPPPQQACYLPSIAGTHLYTWVERSNYG